MSCISIRPLVHSLLKLHLSEKDTDEDIIKAFKQLFSEDLMYRFNVNENIQEVSVRRIVSFLDPRYKDLLGERFIRVL